MPAGLNHAAYEVVGMDDLMMGHFHMRYNHEQGTLNGEHAWGIGRHILGSQIFDYWKDPYGNVLEHWTDGDQLRESDGSNIAPIKELAATQWGPTVLKSRL